MLLDANTPFLIFLLFFSLLRASPLNRTSFTIDGVPLHPSSHLIPFSYSSDSGVLFFSDLDLDLSEFSIEFSEEGNFKIHTVIFKGRNSLKVQRGFVVQATQISIRNTNISCDLGMLVGKNITLSKSSLKSDKLAIFTQEQLSSQKSQFVSETKWSEKSIEKLVFMNFLDNQSFYEEITSEEKLISAFDEMFQENYVIDQINWDQPSIAELQKFLEVSGYAFFGESRGCMNYSESIVNARSIGVFAPIVQVANSSFNASFLGYDSDKGAGKGTRDMIVGDNCSASGGSYGGIGGSSFSFLFNYSCAGWSKANAKPYGTYICPASPVSPFILKA